MAKWRKKPEIIEAFQVTKELVRAWVNKEVERPKEIGELDVWWHGGVIDEETSTFGGMVATLEGNMKFNIGDWLIRGIAGELYPCKNEIFIATYEPV